MSAKKISTVSESQSTNESLSPRGLRVRDAAAYLGVTVFFIRDAVWKNELPAMKLGRRLIIAREDLDRFFDQQKTRCAA
jgi:excisionase family DNA binding protein